MCSVHFDQLSTRLLVFGLYFIRDRVYPFVCDSYIGNYVVTFFLHVKILLVIFVEEHNISKLTFVGLLTILFFCLILSWNSDIIAFKYHHVRYLADWLTCCHTIISKTYVHLLYSICCYLLGCFTFWVTLKMHWRIHKDFLKIVLRKQTNWQNNIEIK